MMGDPNLNQVIFALKQELQNTYGKDIRALQNEVTVLESKMDALTLTVTSQQTNSRWNSILLIIVLTLEVVIIAAVAGLYAKVF